MRMIGRRTKPSTAEVDKPKGFDDFEVRLGDLMRGERATLGKSLLDVQRDLKVKATYIAAIENCDISAFETQGFVAGYVRSYARYLGLNPDWAYDRFCVEANFTLAHGMSAAASPARKTAARHRANQDFGDPLANPNATFIPRAETLFSRVEPGAIGSLLLLMGLIGGIGYGGWSVLQQIQRVQLAPVEQAPLVVAEIDPLGNIQGQAPLVRSAPVPTVAADSAGPQLAADLSGQSGVDRLYRPQALEVPVMTARDGPISGINPHQNAQRDAIASAVAEVAAEDAVQVVASDAPMVELLAVRPSWVQVKTTDGTVLFEKILDAGERYAVPAMETAPLLRAGNSGSLYFSVQGKTYGPAAPGAQVVKNVTLSPESLTGAYALADLSGDRDLAKFVAVAQVTNP